MNNNFLGLHKKRTEKPVVVLGLGRFSSDDQSSTDPADRYGRVVVDVIVVFAQKQHGGGRPHGYNNNNNNRTQNEELSLSVVRHRILPGRRTRRHGVLYFDGCVSVCLAFAD